MNVKKREDVALVTGSRRGIGLGIAINLAREGFRIVLNATVPEAEAAEAVQTVRDTGAEALYVQADVSVAEDRERLLSTVREQFGRLDILVNNAGVSPLVREDILKTTEESFDRLIRINLKGTFFLSQLVANWMIEQKKQYPERTPKIINISSLSAYTASPNRGEYCLSKAGISMTTMLFAVRLAEIGIQVHEIRPGIIATDMTKVVKEHYDKLIADGLTPIRRWGTPEDIGKAVAAIALDYFPFSTGEVFNVDGGFHLRRL
ncbi:MAG: 3-ketoacyl-ACP reductase [Deltaproteobacteria bacterium]|nr:3-ketoacyl-ACP reductase [Deltaproteobacteria bacterium]